jgi:hypothetical protein
LSTKIMQQLILAVLVSALAVSLALPVENVFVSSLQVNVRVALRERNLDQLQQFFHEVSNPSHPKYAKYLSLDQLRDLVGVSDAEYSAAAQWLISQGATDLQLSAARTHVTATMPYDRAAQLERATYSHGGPAEVQYMWLVPSDEVVERTRSAAVIGSTNEAAPLNRMAHLRAAMKSRSASGDAEPGTIKKAMGMPESVLAKSSNNSQMVWGTGTYGVQSDDLDYFWSLWDVKGMKQSLMKYEGKMGSNGDNYKEGDARAPSSPPSFAQHWS